MALEIEEFVAPTAENPFAGDVKTLAEAQEKSDKTLLGKIVVDEKDVKKAKFKISRAANEINLTANHRVQEPLGDGKVAIKFTLGAKHKPRRRKSDTGTVAK